MKVTKDFRSGRARVHSEDALRKAAKLEPIRKSGKEKRAMYSELDEEEGLDLSYRKRESVLDYFDDGDDPEDDPEDDDTDVDDDREYDEDEDADGR